MTSFEQPRPRGTRGATLVLSVFVALAAHACSSASSDGAGSGTGGGGAAGFDASTGNGGAGFGAGGLFTSGGTASGGVAVSGSGGTLPGSGGAVAGAAGTTGGAAGTAGAATGGGGAATGGGGAATGGGGGAATGGGGAATGGGGGAIGGGGAAGAAGASTGGSSPDGGTPDGGSVDCTIGSQTLDPSAFKECPACMGKGAHCVPTNIVMQIAANEIAQLQPCDDTDVCVPDQFIKTLGKYDPPSCKSISDGAGRCLSECIGAVANLGTFLPKANCGDNEKCAPCIDPRNGTPTGACSLQCDTGPTEPNIVFDKCCSDSSGLCVPPSILDPLQAKALAVGSCKAGSVCAPAKFADPTFHPKVCSSIAGAEGRCLSTCVDLVTKNIDLLKQDVCAAGELCAPCTDPRTGDLTAACSLNGDKPTKPPVVFKTECCDTTGLCVPSDAVPAKYTKLLPPDVCADADGGGANYVCAPKIKLNDLSLRLPKCQATLLGIPVPAGDPNQFGACIPQCIADAQIAANPLFAAALAQSDCTSGWVCAPCINPIDGTRTGACD